MKKNTVRKCKRYASVYLSLTFITTCLPRVPDCWIHPWKNSLYLFRCVELNRTSRKLLKRPLWSQIPHSGSHPTDHKANETFPEALWRTRKMRCVCHYVAILPFFSHVCDQRFVGLSAVGFLPVGLMWIDAVVFAVITQKCRTICSLAVRWQQTRAMFALGMCSSRIKSQIRSRFGLIYELHNNKYIKDVENERALQIYFQ